MNATENLPLREAAKEEAERFEMENEAGALGVAEKYHDACEDFRDKYHESAIIAKDEDFDDVCPICLDTFTFPCKSNCGHLFCGGCVLQLWMYRYSIQPCKCPLCCCRIVNLELQASEEADYGGRVRKEVQHYNGLYIPRLFGSLHTLPLLMGRIFRVLADLDYLRAIYYALRIIGLFLGFFYELLEFEFLPTGLGVHRMFDLIASLLVAALFVVGVVYKWTFKRRARLLVVVDSSLTDVT
ncbi:RING-type E3 ubiquitin transferase [Salvia divinorum]|uniref:RING-type E3 ubiquitin transferase n=1 Tax=Salvia divinorum TaxID=28513 RepID=A0ABD1G4X8_SALDI